MIVIAAAADFRDDENIDDDDYYCDHFCFCVLLLTFNWIAEWKSTPYYDAETEQLVCDVNWMYSLKYAPRWYHEHADGPTFDTVVVRNVVLADVVVNVISPENMPPAAANSGTAIELAAMRVSDKSHSFIFDEIYRRSFIEYDPN